MSWHYDTRMGGPLHSRYAQPYFWNGDKVGDEFLPVELCEKLDGMDAEIDMLKSQLASCAAERDALREVVGDAIDDLSMLADPKHKVAFALEDVVFYLKTALVAERSAEREE